MHRIVKLAGLVLFIALPVAPQAAGESQPSALTFEDTLERARQATPAIVAARMRVEEARARLVGASIPFTTNPTVDVEAGRRSGGTSSTDVGIEVGQDIDLPRRRNARVDAVRAGVTQEEQRARDVERESLREVATVFFRALESRERANAATSGKRLAHEAFQIAERRYEAGDVAQLDVNLARTAVARADAEERAANAALAGHATRLQVLLGSSAPILPRGSLRDALILATADLVVRAADRPDVRVIESEIEEAEAERRFARTLRWPELGVRASYAREGDERVFLGGIGVTLPVFHRGQQATAISNARIARLRAEREALMRTIDAEVRGGIATYEALHSAAIAYEKAVLPLIGENEELALESYEAGQIGLADLLLVRREALDARGTFIDQLIELRLAEVELRAKAGVWPGVGK